MQGRHLVDTQGCDTQSGSGIPAPHTPVSDHVDGPQAQGCGDLDDCLPHATVGCILDDRISCGARKRLKSSPGDL